MVFEKIKAILSSQLDVDAEELSLETKLPKTLALTVLTLLRC